MNFEPGKSYPIDTLPDDLHDKSIHNRDRWAIRDALFWNDCQGWWHAHISDYWLRHSNRYGGAHMARFWSPEPASPMTREQILTERGMVICPTCDVALNSPEQVHHCRPKANRGAA